MRTYLRVFLALLAVGLLSLPLRAAEVSNYSSAAALGGTEVLVFDQSGATVSGAMSLVPTYVDSIANAFLSTVSMVGVTTPKGGIAASSPTGQAQNILSPRLMTTCGGAPTTTGTSTANAANTDTYVAEIEVKGNVSTTGAWVYNFATQNGNDTLYLADANGNEILHTASTASSGGSAVQKIAWTASPTTITGPGTYYLYYQNNGSTNTIGMWAAPGVCGTALLTGGTYGSFPATTPPTTFTTLQGPVGGLY